MGIRTKTKLVTAFTGIAAAAVTALVANYTGTELIPATVISLVVGLLAAFVVLGVVGRNKKGSGDLLSVHEVFPTTGLPMYTYQSRKDQEEAVTTYRDHGKGLLSVFGPTKAGKSVLVKKLMSEGVFVRGDVDSAEALWTKSITELAAYTGRSQGTSQSTTVSVGVASKLGPKEANVGSKYDHTAMKGSSTGKSADDDQFLVIQERLLETKRILVIDDFHFMPRSEQRKVMAALKGLIDRGGRAVVITATHRAHLVSSLVPNMGGRFEYVEVPRWSHDDLKRIAAVGFAKLGVEDPADLATELATNSFGSPQLMQRLCRQLCLKNGYEQQQRAGSQLGKPAGSWDDFYTAGLTRMDAEVRWVQKLKRGPQERRARMQYQTMEHGPLDGYEILRIALRNLLPSMDLSKEDIHSEVAAIVGPKPLAPRPSETVSKLKYLNSIALQPLDQPTKSDEDYTAPSDEEELDVDPVLEYEESGPTSTLRIVDPLYAFALRWWRKD